MTERGKTMKKLVLAMTALCFGATAIASSTVGLSTHPLSMNNRVITTEFDNYFSSGDGMGITAKYFQNVDSKLNAEAGVSVNGGNTASRMFAAADYEIFPDYGRQPRLSAKAIIDTKDFDGDRINSIAIAPTVSKGFSFWGNEAFPYAALPMSVGLNTDEGTYETSTALAMGVTGRIPLQGYEKLIGNIETNFNLRNSYTAIVMGVSMPLQ